MLGNGISMSHDRTSGGLSPAFPPTRWTVVLAARAQPSPESFAALETLCATYWYPLYAYVWRTGQMPADAQDLTQEFFRRLLEKNWLEAANPDKGRLRTFLIVALKHFMANEWRRAGARRRGGGQVTVPFDTALAETRYAAEPAPASAADAAYDRQWALTLLDLTLRRLEAEFAVAGRAGDYLVLKDTLMAGRGGIDYAAVAAQLGLAEGAARVAVHRLRKRFREIFRAEIAQTLAGDADLEGELRHLAAVLAQK